MPVIDPLILLRGVHFATTVLACGTVCFMALVAEPAARATMHAASSADGAAYLRRMAVLTWMALTLTVLSGAVWFAVVAAGILDVPVAEIGRNGGAWTVLTETRFGAVTATRSGLAILLALLVAAPHRLPAARTGRLAAAAGLAGLIALTGHAGATPGTAGLVHLTADIAHLVTAAAWLGGLPAFAALLLWAGRDPARACFVIATTSRFSILGMVCVATLLASGLVNGWFLLGKIDDLVSGDYGRLLLVKTALFAGMVALAAVNRFHLSPRLPDPAAARALRRNSGAEIALGLCVLFVAAALGTMPPSGHLHNYAPAPSSEAAYVHIHANAAMADVTIGPGHSGSNAEETTATVRLSREDSTPFPARYVRLTLEPHEPGPTTIEAAAVPAPDGTWRIAALPRPSIGIWTVRISVGTAGTTIVLDAPIVITQCSNEC